MKTNLSCAFETTWQFIVFSVEVELERDNHFCWVNLTIWSSHPNLGSLNTDVSPHLNCPKWRLSKSLMLVGCHIYLYCTARTCMERFVFMPQCYDLANRSKNHRAPFSTSHPGHSHCGSTVFTFHVFSCFCYTECSFWGFLAQTIIFVGLLANESGKLQSQARSHYVTAVWRYSERMVALQKQLSVHWWEALNRVASTCKARITGFTLELNKIIQSRWPKLIIVSGFSFCTYENYVFFDKKLRALCTRKRLDLKVAQFWGLLPPHKLMNVGGSCVSCSWNFFMFLPKRFFVWIVFSTRGRGFFFVKIKKKIWKHTFAKRI